MPNTIIKGKGYQQVSPRSGRLGTLSPMPVSGVEPVQQASQSLDDMIPTVKGQEIPQPSTDWGSGKITGPKGSSGVVRATTKSKKGW